MENNTLDNQQPKKKGSLILWILGWIFFFPIPVMILIWRKKNTWKLPVKIAVTVIFWILLFVFLGSNGDSENEDNQPASTVAETTVATESHIYDTAQIIDLMSGIGSNKIGTVSVSKAKQSDCTEGALLDWYLNYVMKNQDCNYHIIVYTDTSDKGIYCCNELIEKNVVLTPDDDGTYSLGDDSGATLYTVDEATKKLVKTATMADSNVINTTKSKIDDIVPTEYKNSKSYSVDISGEEGNLDCNLTLVSENFNDANYQKIATDLAQHVKNLDLGIGYFCISFQCDDYNLNALSSLDDLSAQEPSEITTSTFDKNKNNNTETTSTETEKTPEPSAEFTTLTDKDIVNCMTIMQQIIDRYIADAKYPWGKDDYTIAKFDDNGAIIAICDQIKLKSSDFKQTGIVVFTYNPISEDDVRFKEHYCEIAGTVCSNDGYCDEFIKNLQEINKTLKSN